MALTANSFYWSGDQTKLLVAVVLFGTWVGLVVGKVEGAEEIITMIKYVLTALGAHWMTAWKATPDDPPLHEVGYEVPDPEQPANFEARS